MILLRIRCLIKVLLVLMFSLKGFFISRVIFDFDLKMRYYEFCIKISFVFMWIKESLYVESFLRLDKCSLKMVFKRDYLRLD